MNFKINERTFNYLPIFSEAMKLLVNFISIIVLFKQDLIL